jgi:hypothetical protein
LLAFALVLRTRTPGSGFFIFVTVAQASVWLLVTVAALLTVRNGHIQQHREWVVRSYALTFTFVATRVFNTTEAWRHLGRASFPMAILFIVLLSLLAADIGLSWRQITTRRT